jgi:undecaprenyl-diphosphatase
VLKNRHLLALSDLPAFAAGFAASFVSAFVCVRWLIRYVSHHDFVPFAWYRIAFGVVILATAWTGVVRWD